jgi:hypothetical protein
MTQTAENRLVQTFRRVPTDRVPIFEHVVDQRFVKYSLGLDQRSLDLKAEPLAKLSQYMHMDVMTLGYRSRVEGTRTRGQFQSMHLPDQAPFLRRVDDCLAVGKSAGLGVNVYVHGPFDSAYLSMGYETFFYNLADDHAFVEEMMDVFTDDAIVMVKALIDRGVTTIEIVDDIAYKNGLFIQPDLFWRLWFGRMQRIMEPILASDTPVFFHSDGDVSQFIDMVCELGFLGLNPIESQCNDIFDVKKRYGDRLTLMGNLEIGGVLAFGTPNDVHNETKRLLSGMMPGYGYVAMSSNSVANCVIPENYMAMVDTVLEFGAYR